MTAQNRLILSFFQQKHESKTDQSDKPKTAYKNVAILIDFETINN